MLGAAGLSLSLASSAPAAIGGPSADMAVRNAGVNHEITLHEEEISDVSLATLYIVDKENAGTFRRGGQLAMGCSCAGCSGCGCWTGADYGASTFGSDATPRHRSIKPAHKYTHAPKRTHVAKKP